VALVSSATLQVVDGWPKHPVVPGSQVHVTVVAPVLGAAVSTTVESKGKAAVHVPGHVMAGGELVTLPFPEISTVKLACVQVLVPTPAAETKAVLKT
jgi:hypothetical protein